MENIPDNLDNIPSYKLSSFDKEKIKKERDDHRKGKEKIEERKEERKNLAKMIATELKDIIPNSKQWLEELRKLKIPEVKSPEVIVNVEKPEIPEIKLPEIPKADAPIINIPKETEIKGIKQFFEKTIKSINDTVKNKLKVILYNDKGTIEKKNPLYVTPIDKNGRIIRGDSGFNGLIQGEVQIKDENGDIKDPATEDKQDDMIENSKGTMSPNNSTTTPLGIDEVFTGVADDIKDYAAINISIWADQASATGGLSIEWSQDGTNWDEKMTVAIGASKVESYEFGVRARYFRLVYTNGGTAQGAFRLQVMYHPVRTREGARCLCVDIDEREFAKTVRAVLAAKKPNGTYTNIHSTAGGNLKVSVEETEPTADLPEFFEDTSFVTSDSPVTLDLNAALGRNATEGTIINDGDGDFTIAFSTNGTDFGDEITFKKDDIFNFDKISVDSLRITWVADSAYRVIAI